MRPTRRGLAVMAIAVAGYSMAASFGSRTLDSVVVAACVSLLAGFVQVYRAEAPTVERSAPPAGFPGERRTVTLTVEGSGMARITDAVPEIDEVPFVRTSLPDTVSYEVELETRGEQTLGPPTIVVGDLLGLFETRTRPDATSSVLVYPEVYDLRGHEAFAHLFERTTTPERQAFDNLREYAPGDPLRDVHWKSSAKREEGDLVVKEFVGEADEGTLHVAATAESGHADEMAAAAASVALLGLEAGLTVAVTCPGGSLPPGHGEVHRRHVLELLARTPHGRVDDRAFRQAEVRIEADDDGVSVVVDGEQHAISLSDHSPTAVAADGGERR